MEQNYRYTTVQYLYMLSEQIYKNETMFRNIYGKNNFIILKIFHVPGQQ